MYALALVIGLLACGDDDSAVRDDGGTAHDDADARAITPPEAPASAERPRFATCPDGWSRVEAEATYCEPWPRDRVVCADHEARFPGSASCQRIGPTCPSGDFADDVPAGEVLYVRPGGTGEGTQAAPFGSIGAAMARASSGTTILLAKGTYDEVMAITSGVRVRGACVEGTLIRSVQPLGADTTVERLTIGRSRASGVLADGPGLAVSLVDVAIVEAGSVGILASGGGSVTAENVRVTRIGRVPELDLARGVVVESGATMRLDHADIGDLDDRAMSLGGGAQVGLEDVYVHDTNDELGAMTVSTGSALEGHRVVVERASGGALAAGSATLTLEDFFVRHTSPPIASSQFSTMNVFDTEANLTRVVALESETGSIGFGTGCDLAAEDVVVVTTGDYRSTGTPRVDLSIAGTTGSMSRVFVVAHDSIGLYVGDGSTFTLRDASILGTEGSQALAGSLVCAYGATLTLERASIVRPTAAGLITLLDATLTASDVLVRDVLSGIGDGFGISLLGGSRVFLVRAAVEGAHKSGVYVEGDVTARIEDLRVTNTTGDYTGAFGRAMTIQSGDVELRRAILEDSIEIGLSVTAGSLEGSDVVVRHIASQVCEGCSSAGFGAGAYNEAHVVLDRFEIADAPLCAVHLAEGGSMELKHGTVRDSGIGVCAQDVPGFDLDLLRQDVVYENNVSSLDTTSLPVPSLQHVEVDVPAPSE